MMGDRVAASFTAATDGDPDPISAGTAADVA
jgi:hypothetical protein